MPDNSGSASVHVVGIGAAAGGFEAISTLFGNFTKRPEQAFVIVQRLAPDFLQLMTEVLASQTEMAIATVSDGLQPQPSSIYLMPSEVEIEIRDGRFFVRSRDGDRETGVIDHFFSSLAKEFGTSAVGIVLSGGGHDGADGARAITDAGGRLIIQQPSTAKFPSMPKAAFERCRTAEILAVEKMADALAGQLAAVKLARDVPVIDDEEYAEALTHLLAENHQIRLSELNHDFVTDALNRMLSDLGIDTQEALAAKLAIDPFNRGRLAQWLSFPEIGFFGFPEQIEVLNRHVLPALADRINEGREVTALVPACGDGREAYTLAVLIASHLGDINIPPTIRIVAREQSHAKLSVASEGRYPKALLDTIPAAFHKYFPDTDDGMIQVSSAIRRMVVFERASPFNAAVPSRCDLIVCRNLFRFLGFNAADRLMELSVRALDINGFIFVYEDDRVGFHSDLGAIDRHGLVLRRKRRGLDDLEPIAALGLAEPEIEPLVPPSGAVASSSPFRAASGLAVGRLLELYAPPSLVIDGSGRIIHQFGDTSRLFKGCPVDAMDDVFSLIGSMSGEKVRHAVDKALSAMQVITVNIDDPRTSFDSDFNKVVIEPLEDAVGLKASILLIFEAGR